MLDKIDYPEVLYYYHEYYSEGEPVFTEFNIVKYKLNGDHYIPENGDLGSIPVHMYNHDNYYRSIKELKKKWTIGETIDYLQDSLTHLIKLRDK